MNKLHIFVKNKIMKKTIVLIVCMFGLVSCGSTAPCGLAKTNKELKTNKQAEITVRNV